MSSMSRRCGYWTGRSSARKEEGNTKDKLYELALSETDAKGRTEDRIRHGSTNEGKTCSFQAMSHIQENFRDEPEAQDQIK